MAAIRKADSSEGVSSLPFFINLSTRIARLVWFFLGSEVGLFRLFLSTRGARLVCLFSSTHDARLVCFVYFHRPVGRGWSVLFISINLWGKVGLFRLNFLVHSNSLSRLVTTFTSGVAPEPLLILNSVIQMTANASVIAVIQLYRSQKEKKV